MKVASMGNSYEAFCFKDELKGHVKPRNNAFCFLFLR